MPGDHGYRNIAEGPPDHQAHQAAQGTQTGVGEQSGAIRQDVAPEAAVPPVSGGNGGQDWEGDSR